MATKTTYVYGSVSTVVGLLVLAFLVLLVIYGCGSSPAERLEKAKKAVQEAQERVQVAEADVAKEAEQAPAKPVSTVVETQLDEVNTNLRALTKVLTDRQAASPVSVSEPKPAPPPSPTPALSVSPATSPAAPPAPPTPPTSVSVPADSPPSFVANASAKTPTGGSAVAISAVGEAANTLAQTFKVSAEAGKDAVGKKQSDDRAATAENALQDAKDALKVADAEVKRLTAERARLEKEKAVSDAVAVAAEKARSLRPLEFSEFNKLVDAQKAAEQQSARTAEKLAQLTVAVDGAMQIFQEATRRFDAATSATRNPCGS